MGKQKTKKEAQAELEARMEAAGPHRREAYNAVHKILNDLAPDWRREEEVDDGECPTRFYKRAIDCIPDVIEVLDVDPNVDASVLQDAARIEYNFPIEVRWGRRDLGKCVSSN